MDRKCKSLKCGHYACIICLNEMAALEGNSKITCMTCRQETILANGVDGLPTNLVVHNMVDIGVLLKSESAVDISSSEGETPPPPPPLFCGQCGDEGENSQTVAIHGCLDCSSAEYPNGEFFFTLGHPGVVLIFSCNRNAHVQRLQSHSPKVESV